MTDGTAHTAHGAQGATDLSNPEFVRLRELVEKTSQSIFLTGKAGTGKSTFLRYIIGHTSKNYAVLAPTGIAAINVGGQTLHSFFRLPLQPVLPTDPDFAPGRLRDRLQLTGKNIRLFKEVELIVIDEISMVRADVIDLIDRILRTFGGDRRKPFGGKQLLLVGDIFQLEPVVTTEDKAILQLHYKHPFFFNADVFSAFGLISIELRKVYRQQNADFIGILDRFRSGAPSHSDMEAVNARVVSEPTDIKGQIVMTLAARRETVARINEMHLDSLKSPEVIYSGEVSGDFPANSYPTEMALKLKEGAQVIFLRNDPERRYANGTLGIVSKASETKLAVRLEDGTEIDVEPATWENVAYEYDTKTRRVTSRVKGTFTQLPIKAAWALTIHKSQGLTFDNIVVELGRGGAFAGGQVYVALSRCTSLQGLSLASAIDARDVFVHPEVLRFARNFNDLQLQEEALRRARALGTLAEADSLYRAGHISQAAERLNDAFSENPRLNTPALRRYIALRIAGTFPQKKRKKK